MRSYGNIWERIVSYENLLAAWLRVRRGHLHSAAVQGFGRDLERNLRALQKDIETGVYRPGPYQQFKVYDPKPRVISCAPVVDRVVHHALCGVIVPLLEHRFVPVSFDCREGFGAHAACALARKYAGRAPRPTGTTTTRRTRTTTTASASPAPLMLYSRMKGPILASPSSSRMETNMHEQTDQ